jgi:hypothetical protein
MPSRLSIASGQAAVIGSHKAGRPAAERVERRAPSTSACRSNALLSERAPQGLTEEHLVEEVVIWRKRRLRLAGAAAYREKLRRVATGWETPGRLVGAALLPITGATGHEASIPDAVAATPAETARDLREAKRDQASTRMRRNGVRIPNQCWSRSAYPHVCCGEALVVSSVFSAG